ncbi:MAG: hypothetical protein MUO64_15955 [Anaerolineales bacterium]|nr:hypothetical protein [Anaerolineales bacterium]
MSQILKPNQTVQTSYPGLDCTVEQFIGGGGQGVVYRAKWKGKLVALKWYFPHAATQDQRKTLETLIKKGPPDERFLWPLVITTAPGVSDYGYIMPLREARYKGILDLMKGRVSPTFRALITAGIDLAHSFLQLHTQGLCYRDISFGNVFFDPQNGEILICDNDNVGIDGEAKAGVLGTPRFMAPEVVTGNALPSSKTDLFSLAVLLFYMLMVHHPLEGAKEANIHCFDLPAMTKLYGTEPVFIFDPQDVSNRPVKGLHDNALVYWLLYPKFLRDLFTKAFTDGIRDPQNGRVRESEWRAALVRLRDAIVYCLHCGAESLYDTETLKASGGKPGVCWSCKQELRLPFRIRIGNNITMLNYDTHLYPHHIDKDRMYDFSKPVAEVVPHPQNPQVWGLKNLSNEKWTILAQDGTPRDIESGKSATLATGLKINFGKTEGEIRI